MGEMCLMKEEVFQIHRYSVGYKIDKQLLLSLKDMFEQYSEKNRFWKFVQGVITMQVMYSIMLMSVLGFDKKPYRIIKMEISVMLERNIILTR